MNTSKSRESSQSRAAIWSALIGSIGVVVAAWVGVSFGREKGEDQFRRELQQRDRQIAELKSTVEALQKNGPQPRAGTENASFKPKEAIYTKSTSPKGSQVEVVDGFTFALRGCFLDGEKVHCDFSITANEDKSLMIFGTSRLIETDGTELNASTVTFGSTEVRGRDSSVEESLVRNVAVKAGITFTGIKPDSKAVSLIELMCAPVNVQFRDVQLQ